MTSCIEVQKQQIQLIKKLFPPNHERFQVTAASLDEISCRFVINSQTKYEFLIDFPTNYPIKPPLWSIQAENEKIQQVLDDLNLTNGAENEIKQQIVIFLEKMCQTFSLQQPDNELQQMKAQTPTVTIDDDIISISSSSDDCENNLASDNDDEFMEFLADDTENNENEKVLSYFKPAKQESSTAAVSEPNAKKVKLATSRNASVRIMGELKGIAKNKEINSKIFTVELVDDSLYEWNVKLTAEAFDQDSSIYKDLMNLKKVGKDYVMLHVEFNEGYPFEPPFIRVAEPMIIGGHIETGGALCMEVVMHRGWSPAYSMESLFYQIASTVSRGGGRVDITRNNYNIQAAKQKFKWLERYYDPNSFSGKSWTLDKTG